MPNYYNPYNFYPATYQPTTYAAANPNAPMTVPMQQSYAAPPQIETMKWVDGEVAAKAFAMPAGLAPNTPIPLWDSTDTIIWLKSWGPMGIPNPLQKLVYEMPEQQNQALLMNGQSGTAAPTATPAPDMSQFATKTDIEQIKNEIRAMMTSNQSGNQNGGGNANGNRGGNR